MAAQPLQPRDRGRERSHAAEPRTTAAGEVAPTGSRSRAREEEILGSIQVLNRALHADASSEITAEDIASHLAALEEDARCEAQQPVVRSGLGTFLNFFVHVQGSAGSSSVARVCLSLLRFSTADANVSLLDVGLLRASISSLLAIVLQGTEGTMNYDERSLPLALAVLSNLARKQERTKGIIRMQPNARKIYKAFVTYLSHKDLGVIVSALSLLVSLLLGDQDVGAKIFNRKNVNQTFQLAFNLLCHEKGLEGAESIFILKQSADLLIDLMDSDEMRSSLSVYPDLSSVLDSILIILDKAPPVAVSAKVLELLSCFAVIPSISSALIPKVFQTFAFGKVSALISSRANVVALVAAKFIALLLRSRLETQGNLDDMGLLSLPISGLVPILNEVWRLRAEDLILKAKVMRLLACLTSHRDSNAQILRQLDVQHVVVNTSTLLEQVDTGSSVLPPHLVEVILSALHLLHEISGFVSETRSRLHGIAQSPKLGHLLSVAMRCPAQELVEVAFEVLRRLGTLKTFGSAHFVSCVVAQNEAPREKQDVDASFVSTLSSISHNSTSDAYLKRSRSTLSPRKSLNPHLEDDEMLFLMERMKKGLEMKELRSSEIMSLYESKCREYALKEAEIVGLEAALGEGRARIGDLEREVHNTTTSAADLVRRHDELQASAHAQTKEILRLKDENLSLTKVIAVLKEKENELARLRIEHETQSRALETAQLRLSEANKAHADLVGIVDGLRRDETGLRDRLALLESHLKTAEQDLRVTSSELRKKTQACEDLRGNLEEVTVSLAEAQDDLDARKAELEIEAIRMQEAEDKIAEQAQSIQALGVRLRHKDDEISRVRDQAQGLSAALKQHEKIAAMIHDLSATRALQASTRRHEESAADEVDEY